MAVNTLNLELCTLDEVAEATRTSQGFVLGERTATGLPRGVAKVTLRLIRTRSQSAGAAALGRLRLSEHLNGAYGNPSVTYPLSHAVVCCRQPDPGRPHAHPGASAAALPGPPPRLCFRSAGNYGTCVFSWLNDLSTPWHRPRIPYQPGLLQTCTFLIPAPQVSVAMGTILREPNAKAMPCGVFGSFGWSGEAVDEMEGRLRDAGFGFAFDAIRVKFKPTAKVRCAAGWSRPDGSMATGFRLTWTLLVYEWVSNASLASRQTQQDLLMCEESGRALAQSIKKKLKSRETNVVAGEADSRIKGAAVLLVLGGRVGRSGRSRWRGRQLPA
mgnify:CR=1 FL=1